jgi:hypothetical protein
MVVIKRFRPGEDDEPPRRAPNDQRALPGISPTSGRDRSGRYKPPKLNALFFAGLCEKHGLPRPLHQWRGHPTRDFIYDFAWPNERVVLEVDGGIYPDRQGRRGAHGSVTGILKGMEKSNLTQLVGLLILRVPYEDYLTMDTVDLCKRAIDHQRAIPKTTEAGRPRTDSEAARRGLV